MNYYNPYFYTIPTAMEAAPRMGLFSRLFGSSRFTLSGFLNGTQRVLNFANQAIPLVKQVKPIVGNAKTMFRVMNEFKKVNTSKTNNKVNVNTKKEVNINENKYVNQENGPTFFA